MIPGFDRRLVPARPDLAAAHLAGLVEASRYVAGKLLQVCEEAVPLYPQPSREESIDTQVLYGETLTVYEEDAEGWAWGQLARDNYVGYVPAQSLRSVQSMATHRVRVPRTFVYAGRSIKLPVLCALPLGAAVAVESLHGDFAEIAGLGYVFASHLAPSDAFESDFVMVAEWFLHAPYLWGGKTWLGLDCSGLVQISLAAAGCAVPRDTDLQETEIGAAILVEPNLAGLQRGDLVFWKGHVGIMRDETTLLHANAHHMSVASEPLVTARGRISDRGSGLPTAVRRPTAGAGV
jgi:cell wall-associated NlpC family hydrolase